jgi:hypothetical protein
MQHYQMNGLQDVTSSDCDPSTLFGQIACAALGQDTSSYTNCSSQADNDPRYTSVTSQLQQVSNWTPTSDYFNPSDIQALVAQQQNLINQALAYLNSVGAACSAAPGCESGSLVSDMQSNLGPGSNVANGAAQLLQAAGQAQSSLTAVVKQGYVQVTGLTSWIQNSLNAVSDAIHAGLVIECQMPSWASLAGDVINGFQSFVNFVMGIVAVAANVVQAGVAAGTAVLQVAGNVGGILDWLLSNLPIVSGFVILGAGGFFAYKHREWLKTKFSRKRSAPIAGLRRRRLAR